MALFTIVLDYCGGTYVHQVRARSPLASCRKWARELSELDVYKLGKTGKADLVGQLDRDKPTPLERAKNVWCVCAIARGKLALINVVKTDQSATTE